ncbi:hypothetical protein SASPL_145573 [Salvia splendens]|uniref:Protein kinase domain-containing protein n=1 Tax=Salvia splendens TaxID=180675 RepID=A0A8X8Z895_SALSN|nr:hypothetical protein SASPL_145573 [Salvia splendens]
MMDTPQSHGQHHEIIPSSSLLIIVVPVILLVAILLLAAMLRCLHSSRANSSSSAASSKRVVHNSNCMFIGHSTIKLDPTSAAYTEMRGYQVQVFTLKEAEKATNIFCDANMIGTDVYRGVLRDGTPAAIKILRGTGRSAERAFRSQVELLCRVRCLYIRELLGYCADEEKRLLVLEYMANGSLADHLRRGTLKWGTRLKIALDCGRALEYLHEHMSPSIIHRNIRSTTILLDPTFTAKLSGFGLAKIGSDKLNGLVSTRVLGTTVYFAPDYGVILLELLTGRLPIDTTRPPGEHLLVSWVAAIAAMCVQTEAEYRPLITDVVQSLMPLVKNHSVPSSSGFAHTPSPKF